MLDKDTIVKAWKDPQFKDSLSEEDKSALPPSPAGVGDLSDEQLAEAAGGTWEITPATTAATPIVDDISDKIFD